MMMDERTAFGALLRQYRVAAGLSQEALAERAGLSTRAISDLERGERQAPYRYTVEQLVAALQLSPVDRERLEATIVRRRGPVARAGVASPPTMLPIPPTPLIGREREVAAVVALLRDGDARLVMLTGAGGIGKTRLAIAAATALLGAFAEGTVCVPLAALTDPELVLPAIAQPLGVEVAGGNSLMDALREALARRQLLLVLDNCEQVLGAALDLATLLGSCPGLRVLATSRAALRLRAERVISVEPLGVPPIGPPPALGALGEYAAIRLFVARSGDVRPDFALTAANAAAVAAICQRLDGLPLAIELAAARTRLLAPPALLERLTAGLGVLTGGARDLPRRQQTLRDTIAWSHDLLTGEERALFARLAVFAGGWTLEAAESVCGPAGDGDVLEGLDGLVGQSLVRQNDGPGGEARFGYLETIREYAMEQLERVGEGERVHWTHTAYYTALAEEAAPHLTGPEPGAWLDRLEGEHDNLRAALGWALGRGERETGLRLGAALGRFWDIRGYVSEGRAWLERALAIGHGAGLAALRARALLGAGGLAIGQNDYAAARALHAESLALFRELGDKTGIARSLYHLGTVAMQQGDYAAARALYEEDLTLKRELGDKTGIANSLTNFGTVARDQGDYAAARALHAESLALLREMGDKTGIARSLNHLGTVARDQGDYAVARALYEESLGLLRELGDKAGIARSLNHLGTVAMRQGDAVGARGYFTQSLPLAMAVGAERLAIHCLEGFARLAAGQGETLRAARLYGAATARRQAIGLPRPPTEQATHMRQLSDARASVDAAAWAGAWEEGQVLSLEAAVVLALNEAPG